MQTCPICFCEDSKPHFLTVKACGHAFCKDCYREYTNTEICNFNILKIKCPEQDCSQTLDFTTLKKTLDASTFEKYKGLLLKKLDNQSRSANICPKPGCSRIFTPLEGENHTICGCGAVICNSCGKLEHEGKSCVAALDPEFEVYASQNELKFCVMCKTVVSKVEGCLHITCPVCDYEWCWLCGREHSEKHPATCPRKWDPLPPAAIMKETRRKDTRPRLVRFRIWMKAFLKAMFYAELFWPYLIFNVPAELRSPDNSIGYKILAFFMAFLIHMVYMVSMVFFVIRMFITPELIPIIFTCAVCLGMLPWLIKGFFLLCKAASDFEQSVKPKPKRWELRKEQEFSYTTKNKPAVPNTSNPNDVTLTVADSTIASLQDNNQTVIDIEIDNDLAENAYKTLTSKDFKRTPSIDPLEYAEPDMSMFNLEGILP